MSFNLFHAFSATHMSQNLRETERRHFLVLWPILEVYTIPVGFLENLMTTSISGLMGLCMGFSFVSLAEIFYYLTLTVWSALEKERRVRKTMEIGEVGDMDCD